MVKIGFQNPEEIAHRLPRFGLRQTCRERLGQGLRRKNSKLNDTTCMENCEGDSDTLRERRRQGDLSTEFISASEQGGNPNRSSH